MDSTKHGLIVDISKYEPGLSLKKFLDAGADGFILRMGGPAQWVEGNWQYTEDPTYRYYMDQAKSLGIQEQIGAYILHNPFEDWRLVNNVHVDLINQWTGGGYLPGYLILDHEVNYCYRGAQKIIATVQNQVSSLNAVTDQMYKKWRRMVMIYTGRWYVDQNGPVEHAAYLDNINRVERQRPMWYAAYINPTTPYSDLRQAIEALPTPSASYIGKYLQCGSYSLANLWQFTDKLQLVGAPHAVDANVTMGTLAEYWDAVGVKTITPPPPPPPPPGDDLAALTARVKALEDWQAKIRGA